MHRCKIILDRAELHKSGHPPCHRFLPVDYGREGLIIRIVRCSMQQNDVGCSIIRIKDEHDDVPTGSMTYDGGTSSIIKVKTGQYMAMVTNEDCPLSSLVSESGCILSTAIPITDSDIEWTLIGPDAGTVHRLLDAMRGRGYEFRVISSERMDSKPILTPKQDLYFTAAWEAGYYEVPKKVDLDDLASSLNISKSTLNVALRTAERNILQYFVSMHDLSGENRRCEHVRGSGYNPLTRCRMEMVGAPLAAKRRLRMTIDPEKRSRMLSYRWAIFIVLAIAYFFVYFHRTTGGAISTTMQEFYGVGAASVALLASAYLYSYTLMQIPSGILTDRLGPRKAATIFIFLIAVGSIVSAVSATSGDFNLMIAGKFIIGIGAAVVYIPIMKILAVWFRKNEFASMSGVLLLVGNVGGIAAATPMVLMMDSLGIQNTYFVLAVITAVIALLCWLVVRNHPQEKELPSIESIVSEETGEPITESTSATMGTVEALKATFTSGRKFWPLAIWFFVMYGTIMLWQASQAGAFYQNIYEFSAGDAGLMVTMVGVGMVFGCPIAGRLSDKVLGSRKRVIIIGTVVYTALWAVIWLSSGSDAFNSFAVQCAINFLFGFFGGFFVVSYAQIKELFPIAMAGTSTAALNLFPFAGGAILITIAGFVVSDYTLAEYQTLWMFAFVLMVIGCICAFLSLERKDVERMERAAAAERCRTSRRGGHLKVPGPGAPGRTCSR